MTIPNQISQFIALLSEECDNATVSIDAPRDPQGEWWLDVTQGRFRNSVSWNPRRGFGVFAADDHAFGDRPDEVYAKPAAAGTRICQLMARSRDEHFRAPMQLRELRHIVGTSQVELAEELEVNQTAISRLENREDLHISTLRQYVAAMGGELELRAKFKDFEARITPAPAAARKARG